MKNLNVGEFKAHFSEVLGDIKEGRRVVISFGKQKEKIAVIIPYAGYTHRRRHLGLLAERANFKIKNGFKILEEDFLTA